MNTNLPLLFQSGFEPTSRVVDGNRLVSRDETFEEKSDWETDINHLARSLRINSTGGDASQRFARIIPEPGNPDNHVMLFQINEGWLNNQSRIARVQFDLYGIRTGLKEFYQTVRIYLPEESFNTVKEYPRSGFWLMIFEVWNNITWSQTVPHRFRVSLYLNKDTTEKSELHFLLRGQDCELFEDGRQRYTTIWTAKNEDIIVPTGEWFTMHYYFKEGNAETGRVIVAIETEKEGIRTVFDVTNFTHCTTDPAPDGVTEFNPLKWYTSMDIANFVRDRGKSLQIIWDDLRIYGR